MIAPWDVGILDLNSEEMGIATGDLMEAAGRSLAREIMKDREPSNVLFLIGTGNNGGDGLVAARYLSQGGFDVAVMPLRGVDSIRSRLARNAYQSLPREVRIEEWKGRGSLKGYDILVDGLLGSGAHGAPRGIYGDAVSAYNDSGSFKVAIDIPTGTGTEHSARADLTVTFHDIKSNMKDRTECGRIEIADIGIPAKAARYVGKGDLMRIPSRSKDSHKGDGGKLLIVGGGPFTGAPTLASLAAVKTGCDLVRVAVPEGIWTVVAGASPDLIVERLETDDPFSMGPEIAEQLEDSVEWADSVLIGPGAGRAKRTVEALSNLFLHCIDRGKSVVVDADGITAVSEVIKGVKDASKILITPHRKELERLLEGMGIGFDERRMEGPLDENEEYWSDDALDPVVRFVRITGCDLLVKGRIDLMATSHGHSLNGWISHPPAHLRYNGTGTPGMSVGGTGDILAGMSAGLMARGMSSFDAASVAAYLSGRAGEITAGEMGDSLSASEMVKRIHHVLSGS